MADTITGAPSLESLSEAATQGEWSLGDREGGYRYINASGLNYHLGLDRNVPWSGFARFVVEMQDGESCSGAANVALVVALVNDFRAGRLHTSEALAQAVAAAREEGVREGLERAADLCGELPSSRLGFLALPGRGGLFSFTQTTTPVECADCIRALIPTPAHTKADPTREALKLAMRFVDRCAGEGLSFDADYEAPAANAVDVCIAIADVLGIEKLDSDAYRDLVAYPPTTAQIDAAPGGRADG